MRRAQRIDELAGLRVVRVRREGDVVDWAKQGTDD